ncbi:hypothetical protein LR48_Vigan05g115300 [Vigna angularis]|uniref:Uncharacterized protein n=1 Tax=Phaseolus angularis TaxID=3914 RepID=A0A0L9ULW5_PHAAN|nr:hypothetical protein LR48_Vigan05g115300 [Vigna angularis]
MEEPTTQNTKLIQRKGELTEEKDALATQLEEANNEVFNEHQAGFQKALTQAAFFYKILLNEDNFDVYKDIYHDQLVNIQDISNEDAKEELDAGLLLKTG